MEELVINISENKENQYKSLIPQIQALIDGETNLVANLANITAALKTQFNWWWVGFYWVEENELILAPFQGPIACARIQKGKGVCGTAWKEEKTIIVPDVTKFSGHIACSSFSKSEIVVPVYKNKIVIGVLDVDSDQLNCFDEIDQKYLEKIVSLIQG